MSTANKKRNFQVSTYTREWAADYPFDLLFDYTKRLFAEAGYETVTHFHTFSFDDYKRGLATFQLVDYIPDHFLMTAPVQDWDDALKWVRERNDHLNITSIGEPGYHGDDFPNNRQMAKVYFTLKQPA